ncbi:hypothetical protein JM84_2996 [Dokdonia sp. Hel_I_63]|uniref:hypothetical protein n=1 Tax=unclassified Dokdonia TaxID=2615033 RepID=UPI00020A7322|nr:MULTISPECIES: hypothetical protein [unclassified Dokdonia]AEE19744.1 membrane protein [Dokdonia sp. 4H-3-7-5]TVZ24038.1 hypothetical protein JM84_2996 [Dokdonia sp. Hel_I_63]
MGLHKILKLIVGIVGIVALVVAGMVWANNEAIVGGDSQNLVDIMILLAWIVIGIAVILVAIFVIKGLFSGNAKNTLIGAGAFLLVVAISYFAASGAEEVAMKDGEILSASGSQWVSAGINAFFILAAVAIVLMVISGAKKLVNK